MHDRHLLPRVLRAAIGGAVLLAAAFAPALARGPNTGSAPPPRHDNVLTAGVARATTGPRLLFAPTHDDDPAFRAAVAALTGGVVDYFDPRVGTPAAVLLASYDAVYTEVNEAYADRVLMGDRLANYVDAGGRALLGPFCTYTVGNSLGGRIMTADYAPVTSPPGTNHHATSEYAHDGSGCLLAGVAGFGAFYRDVLVPQGSGVVAADYVDGEIALAARPDVRVVYLNGAGAQPFASCPDVWPRLLANAATCTSVTSVPATAIGSLHCNDGSGAPLRLGQVVTVRGIVTQMSPTASNSRFYVQDATGGVNVFGTPRYCGQRGDDVTVTGTIAQFTGLTEVSSTGIRPLSVTVNSTGNPQPAPLELTVAGAMTSYQAGCEPNEGRLVTLDHVIVRTSTGGMPSGAFASGNYRLENFAADSSTSWVVMFVAANGDQCLTAPMLGAPIPVLPLNATGVLSQFTSTTPPTDGYQLLPRTSGDLVPLPAPLLAATATPAPSFAAAAVTPHSGPGASRRNLDAAPGGAPASPEAVAAVAPRRASATRFTAGVRILYAPSEADDPAFRAAVAAITGGPVDYFDARFCIPTPDQLAGYDAVFTWSDYAYADRVLMGDRLADFVDAGGRVLLGPFCTFAFGNSLGGRIMSSAYAPVYSPTGGNHFAQSSWAHDGSGCLVGGVSSFDGFFRDVLALQGAGVAAAHYADGEIAIAARPDVHVVYLNGVSIYPLSLCPDVWPQLVANGATCGSVVAAAAPARVAPVPAAITTLHSNLDRTPEALRSLILSREMPAPRAGAAPAAVHAGPRVLFAPADYDDPVMRDSIAAFIGGTVDYFNAGSCTPTPQLLAQYDAVFTWPSFQYSDPQLLGDRLADYVDAGGRVLLGAFSTYVFGSPLGGRIMTAAYAPVTSPSGANHFSIAGYAHDGTGCLFGAVRGFSAVYRDVLTLQGGGVVAAHWDDGEICVAYRPDLRVLYLNGTAVLDRCQSWRHLVANAATCATALAATWQPQSGAPAPGVTPWRNATAHEDAPLGTQVMRTPASGRLALPGAATVASRNVLTPAAASSGPHILYAPAEPDDPDLRSTVAAFTGGTVDYFDARFATPSATLLAGYQVVFTWPDYAYQDACTFGDRLADFVDAGGRVLLGAFSTFLHGNSLDGRIMTSPYAPVTSPSGGNHFAMAAYARDGTGCLFNAVRGFTASARDLLVLQGAGIAAAHWADGEIAVAFRPDLQVVYLNGAFVTDRCQSWRHLIANAATCTSALAATWRPQDGTPPPAAPGLLNARAFEPMATNVTMAMAMAQNLGGARPADGEPAASRDGARVTIGGRPANTWTPSPNVLTPAHATSGPHILYAPAESDDPDLRAAVASLTGATVDYFDARVATPTATLLAGYQAVFTWPDYPYQDPCAFGDVLADFVDAGGRVVLGAFSTFTLGNSLDGRIMGSSYAPVFSPGGGGRFMVSNYASDGRSGLFAGVPNFSFFNRDALALQGAGIADGHYLDGEIAAAYRPDFRVIYLNAALVLSPPAEQLDEWPRLIANACTVPGPGPGVPPARPALYGGSGEGQLFAVDPATGAGRWLASLWSYTTGRGISDIAYNPVTDRACLMDREWSAQEREFNVTTGASLAAPLGVFTAFEGLCFVDNVLYGTTVQTPPPPRPGRRVLYAPADIDDPLFRASIAGFSGGAVDYFDARTAIPTPEKLAQYDAVYTYPNNAYLDRDLMGNRLADFVDAGGRVILGPFCTFTSGNSLGGRIMGTKYCPVQSPFGSNHFACASWTHDNPTLCAHTGVASYASDFRDALALQGGGGVVGAHFGDGEIALAYRADLGVFYVNGINAGALQSFDGCPPGDWAHVIGNIALCAPPALPVSMLRTLDPVTGTSTQIGLTGFGPVVGLAWDVGAGAMYGITGWEGGRSSRLLRINVASGHATLVGPTGFDAASLAFGSDGQLYAGGSLFDGGRLHRIDKATAASTVVGATGFTAVPGLMPVTAAGALAVDPAAGPTALAIRVTNPAVSGATVHFTLPTSAPAQLELLDVNGRRISGREVGGLGAGAHALELERGTVAPGLYVLRLVQGATSASTKLVVLATAR